MTKPSQHISTPSLLSALGKVICSKRKAAYWIYLLLFGGLWCLLRLPWIDCDGGVPSIWEYGYFVTDEGYYLSGGKEKYLFGHFVDMLRHESFSYGFSAGTHILSWLAHLAFGLSAWKWRIPFLLINFTAWTALFTFTAKRTRPLFAFLTCAAVSCTPLLIAYERTASNDVLIASLLVLAYVIATGRKWWMIPIAALIACSIVLVKPSVYVLLPIVLCGILTRRKLNCRWQDVLVFAGSCAIALLLYKYLLHALVRSDAAACGITTAELIRQTTTHYPLPNLLDIPGLLKGLAAFPRTPANILLGVWTVVIVVCPIAMFLRRLVSDKIQRLNYRMLLYLTIPAYAAAVSIMNTLYTHYYIPLLMMIPVLWTEMRLDLRRYSDGPQRLWIRFGIAATTLALIGVGLAIVAELKANPQEVQPYFSQIYNLPAKNVWGLTWPYFLSFGALLLCAGFFLGRKQQRLLVFCAFAAAAFGCLSVSFATLPAFFLAPFIKQQAGDYLGCITAVLIAGIVLIFIIFYFSRFMSSTRRWFYLLPILFIFSVIACPHWQQSIGELLRPGMHHQEKAVAEFMRLLPPNAIVIGERSNHLFLSTPIRTATTFAHNSDPTTIIKAAYKKDPTTPLFALVDSQHTYCLQHYKKAQNWCMLTPLTKVRLPSCGDARLIDIHLCTIRITKQPPD